MSLAVALYLVVAQAGADAPTAPVPTPAPATEPRWVDTAKLSGYARMGYFATFPFRDEQLVGGHAGFRVADFRVGLDLSPIEKMTVSTSVELSSAAIDPRDPLSGRRIVELKDAFLQYDGSNAFQVKVGQFRPGYWAELLQSDATIPFTARSVLATGTMAPEGYGPTVPLAPDRQVGAQLGSARLGSEHVGLKYTLGVFNGNGPNQLFNDNNAVAAFGRVEVDVHQKVTLGLNAAYDTAATGVRPVRLYTNQLSWGADLVAHVWKLDVLAGVLGRSSTFADAKGQPVGLKDESALGALGQVRYLSEKTGLEAAVRVAWYDPSSAQVDDSVIEGAVMLGWRPFHKPFRVLVQYTMRQEEARVSYPNDSVDVMIHATW